MAAEKFLILPHPKVLDYMRIKTAEYDRWLGGMQKLFVMSATYRQSSESRPELVERDFLLTPQGTGQSHGRQA